MRAWSVSLPVPPIWAGLRCDLLPAVGVMEESYEASSSTPSRRLAVLQGHLKPGSSCTGGVRVNPCGAGSKAAPQSSAPMSSSKDEVQKAFPRQR